MLIGDKQELRISNRSQGNTEIFGSEVFKRINYDFAAKFNEFAAKISPLIFNEFAAHF